MRFFTALILSLPGSLLYRAYVPDSSFFNSVLAGMVFFQLSYLFVGEVDK